MLGQITDTDQDGKQSPIESQLFAQNAEIPLQGRFTRQEGNPPQQRRFPRSRITNNYQPVVSQCVPEMDSPCRPVLEVLRRSRRWCRFPRASCGAEVVKGM